MRQLKLLSLTLFIAFFGTIHDAPARPAVDATTQAEIDSLYTELLTNPTDRTLNLRYSIKLSKAGDYEAAIPPLERILVSEPHNAWLMVQLATLYSALEAKLMARTYLERALAEPEIDEDVAQKANALLATL